jgi:hypothetical protein
VSKEVNDQLNCRRMLKICNYQGARRRRKRVVISRNPGSNPHGMHAAVFVSDDSRVPRCTQGVTQRIAPLTIQHLFQLQLRQPNCPRLQEQSLDYL